MIIVRTNNRILDVTKLYQYNTPENNKWSSCGRFLLAFSSEDNALKLYPLIEDRLKSMES